MSALRRIWPYIVIALVLFSSGLAVFLFTPSPFLQFIVSIPAFCAIVAFLAQLSRDHVAFDRSIFLQASQNGLVMGANSHMANVAFDKHVLLSEEYVAEIYSTLLTLFREGPSTAAMKHAAALGKIREKYAVWLTSDLDRVLLKTEAALRKIGAAAAMARHAEGFKNPDDAEAYQRAIGNMYREFANLLGPDVMGADSWKGEKLSPDEAIEKVISRFREILGIEQLAKLRGVLVNKAIQSL